MKKKSFVVALAIVLIVSIAVCSTFAYITYKGTTIENTFTVGKVDIAFAETTGGEGHNFTIIPGKDTAKDPKVTVANGSEDSYVFVELQEVCTAAGKSFDTYLKYTVNSSWKELSNDTVNHKKVYYYVYKKTQGEKKLEVLVDNKVTAQAFGNTESDLLKDAKLALNINSGAIQDSADFTGATEKDKALSAWKALTNNALTLITD